MSLFLKILAILIFSLSFGEESSPIKSKKKEIQVSEEKEKQKESSEESESASARFGPKLAVTAFDKDEGFQLSDKAIQHLGVSFQEISGSGPWVVAKEALIHIKQTTGVYRRYKTWITFVIVKVTSQDSSQVKVSSSDLESGDEIASKGAQFLRLAEADLTSTTVDSCAN